MYIIAGTVIKQAQSFDEAKKIAVQLTLVYSVPFYIKEYKDIWSVDYDR